MRDTLVDALGKRVADFQLVPSRGGCFELTVDGVLVFSKLKTGEFPDDEALAAALVAKSNA